MRFKSGQSSCAAEVNETHLLFKLFFIPSVNVIDDVDPWSPGGLPGSITVDVIPSVSRRSIIVIRILRSTGNT